MVRFPRRPDGHLQMLDVLSLSVHGRVSEVGDHDGRYWPVTVKPTEGDPLGMLATMEPAVGDLLVETYDGYHVEIVTAPKVEVECLHGWDTL